MMLLLPWLLLMLFATATADLFGVGNSHLDWYLVQVEVAEELQVHLLAIMLVLLFAAACDS